MVLLRGAAEGWGAGAQAEALEGVEVKPCPRPANKSIVNAYSWQRNEMRFRGGLVFKAHRWLYHSTLGSRVVKKKGEEEGNFETPWLF